MRSIPSFFVLAAAVTLASPPVYSQEDVVGTPEIDPLGEHLDAGFPTMIRIFVEFIEVDSETATELLEDPRRGTNDGDLRKRALGMVKNEKSGRVLETAMINTRSGQRSKVESNEEIIYPTEYDPPYAQTKRHPESNKTDVVIAPPNPTAFDTRTVGLTLEVDPVIDADGVTIELNIAPELIYEGKPKVYAEWRTKEAEEDLSMPVFYSMKFSTALTMLEGQPQLAALLSPKGEDGKRDGTKKVLAFVRADLLRVGK